MTDRTPESRAVRAGVFVLTTLVAGTTFAWLQSRRREDAIDAQTRARLAGPGAAA